MNPGAVASLFVRIAPFLAIIVTELTGRGYESRLASVYRDHSDETPLGSPELEDCEDFALFSFDHENAVQHLDLTLVTLVILFGAQVLRTVDDRRALALSAVVFILAIIAIYGVRRTVDGYLQRRSPHKYFIDEVFGVRYGTAAVVGSNAFAILVLVTVELTVV